jgi:hypothetical protein
MPPSAQLAPHMIGFLQSWNAPDEYDARNWANWLVYYIGKLASLGEDAGNLGERQLVNIRVQLSYGPFVQVFSPEY